MSLLTDATAMLVQASTLLRDYSASIEELTAERDNWQRMANQANSALRQLVEAVDPSIWRDGQADTAELLAKVHALKHHDEWISGRYTHEGEDDPPASTQPTSGVVDVHLPGDDYAAQ